MKILTQLVRIDSRMLWNRLPLDEDLYDISSCVSVIKEAKVCIFIKVINDL